MENLTLSQAIEWFIAEKTAAGKSRYTIRNYRNSFSKVALYIAKGDPELSKLTRTFWVDFFTWLRDDYIADPDGVAPRPRKPLSEKSIFNIYGDLSSFYTWATSYGLELTKDHLIRTIERPRFEPPLIVPFTKAEVARLLEACNYTSDWHNERGKRSKRHTSQRDRAIVHTLLSTGVRISELCGIQFQHLDMDQRKIEVAGKGRGRDSKPRRVEFGKVCSTSLWRYMGPRLKDIKPSDFIFVHERDGIARPLNNDSLGELLRRLGERAGIENVHAHRFRHTFATQYLINEGNVRKLQYLLGHSSIEMTMRYAHIVNMELEDQDRNYDPNDNWKLKA